MTTQTLETPDSLEESTLEGLQDLLQANLDSARGFEEVAADVTDTEAKACFQQKARQRHAQAADLTSLIERNGEEPQRSGSWLAAYHRTWIATKAALTSGEAGPLLTEIVRGERYLADRYESVIKETAGSAVSDVLHRQLAAIRASLNEAEGMKARSQCGTCK